MPEDFAASLASTLSEIRLLEPFVFELANGGFSLAVAKELRELGFRVEHHQVRPWLTIYPKPNEVASPVGVE